MAAYQRDRPLQYLVLPFLLHYSEQVAERGQCVAGLDAAVTERVYPVSASGGAMITLQKVIHAPRRRARVGFSRLQAAPERSFSSVIRAVTILLSASLPFPRDADFAAQGRVAQVNFT
ncbi:hypothetical protein [Amycolatopsis panacis]|uniref:Uncharacterized protein n=1 Tax=Amycolatopsis panacis TaxID=2340917 RepID=A0A419I9Y3_9PSEU|nr:hypothetical protein [Amycolatopsis panacis]RJQ89989.1 hypothetical protein D5S19_03245 [Amycolatopsis panacis]